jgi:predicted RNA-binding protein YlqC (UPF0109 family)
MSELARGHDSDLIETIIQKIFRHQENIATKHFELNHGFYSEIRVLLRELEKPQMASTTKA